MDGDNAHDDIAPIICMSNGQKGIAICRVGTWLSLIGYDPEARTPLKAEYYTLGHWALALISEMVA